MKIALKITLLSLVILQSLHALPQEYDLGKQKYLSGTDLLIYGFDPDQISDFQPDSVDLNTAAYEKLLSHFDSAELTYSYHFQMEAYNPLTSFGIIQEQLEQRVSQLISDPFKNTTGGFSFSNSLEIQSYHSNLVFPFSRSEASYLRIYANPTLTVFNLPFETSIFYTTEDNSFYNSNSVSFRFNPNLLKQNIQTSKQDIEQEAKNQFRSTYDHLTDLEKHKSNLENQRTQIDKKIAQTQNKLNQEYLSLKAEQKHRLDSLKASKKDSINQSLSYDSLNRMPLDAASIMDSSMSVRYERLRDLYLQSKNLEEKKKELDRYYNQTDSLIQLTGALQEKIESYIDLLNQQPDDLKKQGQDSMAKKIAAIPILSATKDLELGLFNPYYSKNSLNGIAVKGVNILQEFEKVNLFYRFSMGKAQQDFNSFFSGSTQSAKFSRNLIATKCGIGMDYGNNLYVVHVQIWDPLTQSETSESGVNSVSGVGFNQRLNKLSTSGEILFSTFKNRSFSELHSIPLYFDLLNNYSINGNLEYSPSRSLSIKTKYEKVAASFRALGTPYRRNDYQLVDLKAKWKHKSNKLSFSTFYKHMISNLSEINSPSNIMKGFGVQGQTRFKKYPNLLISYSPFEQSNNHTDTFQRTNNQFKVVNAMVFYQKSFQNHSVYGAITFNQSIIQYQEFKGQENKTTMLICNLMYQNQRIRSSLSYFYSVTTPYIDTLTYHNFTGSVSYDRMKYQIKGNVFYKKNLSGGLYSLASFGYKRKLTKSFNVQTSIGIGLINQLWEFENEKIYQVSLNLQYRL